jgi:methionyl-tRNA formyltransferase
LALEHALPVLQPESVNAPEPLAAVRALEPDALVIAAFGQLLKQPLLDVPRRGSLNVHASLLPKCRGAAPVAGAILAGEDETGVTIMEVELALDAGPVVAQRSLAIEPEDTTGSLTEKISEVGAELLMEVLPRWGRREMTAVPQDGALATLTKPVRRTDAAIDWTLPAIDIWRRVRAYNPWPIATTTVQGTPLRILGAWPLTMEGTAQPGTVLALPVASGAPADARFAVRCGSGSLAVVRAQRPGRRAVSGAELLRGWRDLIGQRLS